MTEPCTLHPNTAADLRILLVEDSEDNILVLRLYLRDFPFVLDVARNGREGLERFSKEQYDLVIMDIQMPVMDGYEATVGMRAVERGSGRGRTPIWVLTAYASVENQRRMEEAGCDGYLTKPIPKPRLLTAIAQATGCFRADGGDSPASGSS